MTIAGLYSSGAGGKMTAFFNAIADENNPVPADAYVQASTLLVTPVVYHVSTEAELRTPSTR